MDKSGSLRFGVRLTDMAPDCPYIWFPCLRFYINLMRGVCCEGHFRCSWLPYWVTSVSCGRYAVLRKDGKLHV
jgi:hypothetical protein